MKKLLVKDFKLAMHPTSVIFLALSMMLIIPNYPYYVVFFYTGLAVFFTCLNGREFNDIFFSMTLPVSKRDIVAARISMVVILEVLQIIVAIPFALLRQSFSMPGNEVGMDANIALFGLALVMLGGFNFFFFTSYYKNVQNVGGAFIKGCTWVTIFIAVAETFAHAVPFFRDKLDTKDTEYVGEKLIVLGIGIVVFVVFTLISYKKSVKRFEMQDL